MPLLFLNSSYPIYNAVSSFLVDIEINVRVLDCAKIVLISSFVSRVFKPCQIVFVDLAEFKELNISYITAVNSVKSCFFNALLLALLMDSRREVRSTDSASIMTG